MTYYHWLGRKAEKHHRMTAASVNDALRQIMVEMQLGEPKRPEADGDITLYPKL